MEKELESYLKKGYDLPSFTCPSFTLPSMVWKNFVEKELDAYEKKINGTWRNPKTGP